VPSIGGYKIVKLRNGAHSVHSLADDETFHPGIGPVAEAEALYVRQLRLPERVRETEGEFVLWDVGLGAAANALTALKLIAVGLTASKSIRLVSFDQTTDALVFALEHIAELSYPVGHEIALAEFLKNGSANFNVGVLNVEWMLQLGDFPGFMQRNTKHETRTTLSPPHAIMFDPHSPKKNPAMWTAPLFANLFHCLDPLRPCALATFTRSTMARAAMLLGGFFVGVGHPSGLKEETTVAANKIQLIDEPLERRWLERAKRSHSAEPLHEPMYLRAPLTSETWEKLRQHPQFS
jgi:tRNA U34 5-methylaminomethyl-2-thiouridine-forming methyltransferase MnmC